jgi:hypothetical protein
MWARTSRINPGERLRSTRELLGYAPQDDAFAVFQQTLGDWLRD